MSAAVIAASVAVTAVVVVVVAVIVSSGALDVVVVSQDLDSVADVTVSHRQSLDDVVFVGEASIIRLDLSDMPRELAKFVIPGSPVGQEWQSSAAAGSAIRVSIPHGRCGECAVVQLHYIYCPVYCIEGVSKIYFTARGCRDFEQDG